MQRRRLGLLAWGVVQCIEVPDSSCLQHERRITAAYGWLAEVVLVAAARLGRTDVLRSAVPAGRSAPAPALGTEGRNPP